jgi:hypothetical protein
MEHDYMSGMTKLSKTMMQKNGDLPRGKPPGKKCRQAYGPVTFKRANFLPL